MKLPLDFEKRMREYLGEEWDAFLASYDYKEVKSLRFNLLRDGKLSEDFLNNLSSEVTWADNANYYEEDDFKPGSLPYHEAGAYYIQEASAMLPAKVLGVKPGDRVLDLCAAPGGKSTELAGYLKGEGILVANEIIKKRALILSENIERIGVHNALVTNEDPRDLSVKLPLFFDKVLVDAPCSGEGMFRRSETARDEWSLENVKICQERQEWILDEAVKMLRPGGDLVYSTCTFAKEENELNIEAFLERHEDFELSDIDLSEGLIKGYNNTGVRILPHKAKGEGHFICRLHRKCSGNETVKSMPVFGYEDNDSKNKKIINDSMLFLKELLRDTDVFEGRNKVMFSDNLYILPKECPSLKGLKIVRAGLNAVTVLKNRMEPAHSLSHAFSEDMYKNVCRLSGDDDRVYKYINGETFNYEGDNGWYLISVDGFGIGFGKLTQGIMKNHYPKGLRKMLKK